LKAGSRAAGDDSPVAALSRAAARGLDRGLLTWRIWNHHVLVGRRVHELSGGAPAAHPDERRARQSLSVRPDERERECRAKLLDPDNGVCVRHRSHGGRRQRSHFVLERLQSVDAIAYIREASAIHIAVASDAASKLALLRLM
jgi:hypothetical protein